MIFHWLSSPLEARAGWLEYSWAIFCRHPGTEMGFMAPMPFSSNLILTRPLALDVDKPVAGSTWSGPGNEIKFLVICHS